MKKPNWIYVDVDGTLLKKGKINKSLVAFIVEKKKQGYKLVLWSMNGQQHATRVAKRAGLVSYFEAILSKPGYIIDDKGWTWTEKTQTANMAPCKR